LPFTFSHPAAVLPLRRFCPARLDFAALVIGSLMPDIGYYIPGFTTQLRTHSLSGIIILCLPGGLLLLALFHRLKQALCYVLPQPHRGALTPLAARLRPDGASLGIAAASVLLGAWTHIAWDSFTHARRWGVLQFPLLGDPVFWLGGRVFPVYLCLQYLSSMLGGLILLRVYQAWLCRQEAAVTTAGGDGKDRWRYFLLGGLGAAALAVSLPIARAASAAFSGSLAWQVFSFQLWVNFAGTFACLVALCAALLFRLKGTALPDQ